VFAAGAYAGDKLATALRPLGRWPLEIVKRSDHATGFQVLPKRWLVEPTVASLCRNRRLAKDFETLVENATTDIYIAMIKLMTRRLARLRNPSNLFRTDSEVGCPFPLAFGRPTG
jgi:putative transposase